MLKMKSTGQIVQKTKAITPSTEHSTVVRPFSGNIRGFIAICAMGYFIAWVLVQAI